MSSLVEWRMASLVEERVSSLVEWRMASLVEEKVFLARGGAVVRSLAGGGAGGVLAGGGVAGHVPTYDVGGGPCIDH